MWLLERKQEQDRNERNAPCLPHALSNVKGEPDVMQRNSSRFSDIKTLLVNTMHWEAMNKHQIASKTSEMFWDHLFQHKTEQSMQLLSSGIQAGGRTLALRLFCIWNIFFLPPRPPFFSLLQHAHFLCHFCFPCFVIKNQVNCTAFSNLYFVEIAYIPLNQESALKVRINTNTFSPVTLPAAFCRQIRELVF